MKPDANKQCIDPLKWAQCIVAVSVSDFILMLLPVALNLQQFCQQFTDMPVGLFPQMKDIVGVKISWYRLLWITETTDEIQRLTWRVFPSLCMLISHSIIKLLYIFQAGIISNLQIHIHLPTIVGCVLALNNRTQLSCTVKQIDSSFILFHIINVNWSHMVKL